MHTWDGPDNPQYINLAFHDFSLSYLLLQELQNVSDK